MALIPAVIGVGGFMAGYITSRYMAPSAITSDISLDTLKNINDDFNDMKRISPQIAQELKCFEKNKLNKVIIQNQPFRTPDIINILQDQLASRRLSIAHVKNKTIDDIDR